MLTIISHKTIIANNVTNTELVYQYIFLRTENVSVCRASCLWFCLQEIIFCVFSQKSRLVVEGVPSATSGY